MKLKTFRALRTGALVAVGVFLGRGAHADTVIDFDSFTGLNNQAIDQSLGDYASSSSDGVTVTGFGTPNIGLSWEATGDPATRWEYYNDSVWSAGKLNHSFPGTANDIVFTPNNASAQVVIKSFNFFPYYAFADTGERFTFDVSILSGTNVVSGPIHTTFQTDGTKNHSINLNYTGAPGQTLKLRLARVASVLGAGEVEGAGGDIAADDITFAQLPATALPAGPSVVSVTPADDQDGVAGAGYSYSASITNGASTTVVGSSIKLKFDGSIVSPTVSSASGLTNVNFTSSTLLAAGSFHFYTLTYDDSASAHYTNEVVFKVANYTTLPASYASPAGSGSHPGFTYRSVAVNQDTTNTLDSTIAQAKAQLAGTLIDVSTGAPYTNAATPGPNPDGSYNVDTVINFNDAAAGTAVGNFSDDVPFPGLDFGPYNWFSTEAKLFLELPAGYYRLGVNSDDGFEVNALPPQGVSGAPIVLSLFDDGRSASDTLFDILVPTSGIYIFQLIYFESTGAAECEFFSVTNLVTGNKVLINDLSKPNAIRSYRVIPPRITSIARNGSNVDLKWAYGLAPFQVQTKTNITSTIWNNVGSPTSNSSASVSIIPGGTAFFRIVGSP